MGNSGKGGKEEKGVRKKNAIPVSIRLPIGEGREGAARTEKQEREGKKRRGGSVRSALPSSLWSLEERKRKKETGSHSGTKYGGGKGRKKGEGRDD